MSKKERKTAQISNCIKIYNLELGVQLTGTAFAQHALGPGFNCLPSTTPTKIPQSQTSDYCLVFLSKKVPNRSYSAN